MKKLLYLTVVIAVLAMASGIAYAGYDWAGDPIFKVEGTIVNVFVAPEEGFGFDASEVKVELRVPKGVEAELVDSQGFDCKVKHRGKADDDDEIPLQVKVKVPKAKPKFDVQVTVEVPDYRISESEEGRTGKWIKVEVELDDD